MVKSVLQDMYRVFAKEFVDARDERPSRIAQQAAERSAVGLNLTLFIACTSRVILSILATSLLYALYLHRPDYVIWFLWLLALLFFIKLLSPLRALIVWKLINRHPSIADLFESAMRTRD